MSRDRSPGSLTIAAVVLAAGHSKRLGESKALLDIGGEPLVHRTVRCATEAGLNEVVVVLGHLADEVASAIADLPAKPIVNPEFDAGQGRSVAAGIRGLAPHTRAAIVIPCDLPRLTAGLLVALVDAFGSTDRSLIVPTFGGERRAPVLVGSKLFPQLLELRGDRGARQLFPALEDQIFELPLIDGEQVEDIDTWRDYERLSPGGGSKPPD